MMNREEVERVAKLARLNLSEKEVAAFSEKLSAVLNYFDQLKEVDTRSVEPLLTPLETELFLREDGEAEQLVVEEALRNAPARTGNLFKVPPVV